MREDIKDTYELDVHVAEILAYSEVAHREEAIRLRKIAAKIASVPKLKPWLHDKADWHADKGAPKDSDKALQALEEGDIKMVEELTRPGRKPDKPNLDELPQEHRPAAA